MNLIKNKQKSGEEYNDNLIIELRKINNEIERAYDCFQTLTDSDLLDASIYRIKELKSRYSYLLKIARENNIRAEYMNFEKKETVKNA